MNKNMLKIDISDSNNENKNGEDLMKIKLKSQNTVQINFSKFLFRSKYACQKCSEIMKSIEKEIAELENKFEIKEEIIKEFIEIVEEGKVFIPIEHYKDIYTLSKHFCITELTNLLDNMMEELLANDLNFSIQILLDQNEEKTTIVSNIEKFLQMQVNECLKNYKFKELPIQTIYRIIESAMLVDQKAVDVNILLDFILESAMNRFILFRFVEFHRLKNDKIDKFIKFIDEQEESSKQIYLEYIPFDFLFIKQLKYNYDEILKNFNQIQEELKQTKEKFKQNQEELQQTKDKFKQNQEELQQTKDKFKQNQEELQQTKDKFKQNQEELQQTKDKFKQNQEELKQTEDELKLLKQCSCIMMVGGRDKYNQLGQNPNKKYGDYPVIHPSLCSSINPSSLLSFSIYLFHSVQVTKSHKLFGIGDNRLGEICDSLPKKEITQFTEFSIKDHNGSQLDPISAVCSLNGTLYLLSSDSGRNLVLCDGNINKGHPVFLNIGDEYPVSLFGGRSHSAAITNKGEIIFINRDSVKKSPDSNIKSVSLPDGEKAVSVSCCDDSVVALSSKGRVFLSDVQKESNILKFSTILELSGQEIIWVSGISEHFLAVNRKGQVFGCGSNSNGRLGLEQNVAKVSSFTVISSLNDHEIRAAYAGHNHSLFETREGKILACGYNYNSELLLSSKEREDVYSPTETTITKSATFCIAGANLSAVFIRGDPPPNIPNRY